jgi:hypothetical protein
VFCTTNYSKTSYHELGDFVEITWQRVLPVIVSILLIITVAILRQYSKSLAAVLVTMPLNITLGLWVVFAGEENNPIARAEFAQNLLVNIFPTIIFLIVVFIVMRAGWTIASTLVVGYAAWGISLLLLLGLRRLVGF